jgi:hypothetical protein
MKRYFFLTALTVVTHTLPAQNFSNSISVDPITFVGLLLSPANENGGRQSADIRNMWFCYEWNQETANSRELGLGIFVRADRAVLRAQYRSFYNKKRQSGFFWGFYGHVEWRMMYWLYDDNRELSIGWNFPFVGNDNVFHSLGVTGGLDIGFRIRGEKFGVTPYAGLGIPLFFCFGDMPPETDRGFFYLQNAVYRAFDIGIRLDFFL